MIRAIVAGLCVLLSSLGQGLPCRADIASVGGVTVISGTDLDCYLETRGGATYISVPGTREWALAESTQDYHAMPARRVEEAIRAVNYPIQPLEILVVILPMPRRQIPESSAEGRVIFLSPGRVGYPEEHIHYIVAHELGHVVQHMLMPESRQDLWARYEGLRGLDLADLGARTGHAYRAAEIFAEDFRVLFGGDLARCGGNIENHELEAPDEVSGLKEFMLSLASEWEGRIRISAFPNPFRSKVVFEAFTLGDAGRPVEVMVFDTVGRKIRDLGRAETGSAFLVWDGRDEGNSPVAPGVYFVHIAAGDQSRFVKLIRR